MGRKRWWRGGLELLVLCILHHAILGESNVGCLFSENLCDSRTETCYNDLAFGKCIPLYADLDGEDLYQYNLDTEELELLRLQLERLENEGYKWSHPYTQCIMQTSLYNFRHGLKQDFRLCHHLKMHDERRFEDRENVGSQDFRPVLNANPQDVLLNRIYYIPDISDDYTQFMPNDKEIEYLPTYDVERPEESVQQIHRPKYPYNDYISARDNDRFYDPGRKVYKKSLTLNEVGEQLFPSVRHRHKSENYFERPTLFKDSDREDSLNEPLWQVVEKPTEEERMLSDDLEFLPENAMDKQVEETLAKNLDIDPADEYERVFSRKYKHPKRLSSIEFLNEQRENPSRESGEEKESNVFSKDDDYPNASEEEVEQELEPSVDVSLNEDGIYTEGGLVQPLAYAVAREDEEKEEGNGNPYGVLLDDDLNELLWRRELAGFKRRERLDVKKPGPLFSTNNYAFKTQSPRTISEDKGAEGKVQDEILLSPIVKKKLNSNDHDVLEGYRNVDMDHVYIVFRQSLGKWKAGREVIRKVGSLLGLNPESLTDVRIGRAEVTFKVAENDKNYNATDVANSIDAIRDKLKDDLGVEVLYAGIGDKIKLPPSLDVSSENEITTYYGAILAAGVAAAATGAAVTVWIGRRVAKSREKLAGLATPDPEASKDYQDLCRVRMQAKQPSDKPESPRVPKSRESESNNSPSNRSSTSSWTEEPSLLNMDISTGHMVLSYMEDHLKNKDRLDQEWAALCAYEADPSSTEIAESETNRKYNRPGVAVPYDHSRIVLNDLANANSCDYINASTITDHDPRNPAYITTQGPLPHTTADFWQLVWEQGSVVIVMLTRLTEDGHAMCHRYWPEEGSELYHIYEVHLVSEHFWCDDYLVRSFYLKNLRTGETRTVTQFHFLSWPENSVPHSTKALLEFRRKVNKSYRGRSCPIVVHCSDGAGRTGTYCLIDMVLNRMAKGAKEIDIAATLEHIRDQRPDMVATKQQFEFVLMAVAEEVHAILKALPVPPTEKQATGSGGGGSVPATKSDH